MSFNPHYDLFILKTKKKTKLHIQAVDNKTDDDNNADYMEDAVADEDNNVEWNLL